MIPVLQLSNEGFSFEFYGKALRPVYAARTQPALTHP